MHYIVTKETIMKFVGGMVKANPHAEGFMIRQGQGGGFLAETGIGKGKFVKDPNKATILNDISRIASHCRSLNDLHEIEPCVYMLTKDDTGKLSLQLVMLIFFDEEETA